MGSDASQEGRRLMVACPDTFEARVFPQLQTRPGDGDCGPACVGEAMYIASCGAFRFNAWTDSVATGRENRVAFVVKVRALGGSPHSGSTKTVEMHRAYTSSWAAARF